MASVTLIIADTDAGGVSINSSFKPAIGAKCSLAQSAALEIMNRTAKEYGLPSSSRLTPLPDRVLSEVNPTGGDL
jgi:hypothetical protein